MTIYLIAAASAVSGVTLGYILREMIPEGMSLRRYFVVLGWTFREWTAERRR